MSGGASIRYTLREPFERAVDHVRGALEQRGLRVVGEMDVSRRVERVLGINLSGCRVVFVLPADMAELDCDAAAFLPLHVVVTSKGVLTEIAVLNRLPAGPAVQAAQAQICLAIEGIAMRRTLAI